MLSNQPLPTKRSSNDLLMLNGLNPVEKDRMLHGARSLLFMLPMHPCTHVPYASHASMHPMRPCRTSMMM